MFVNLEQILNHISFSIISIVITINFFMIISFKEIIELRNASEKGMVAAFFSTTGLLICRWIYLEHFPLSNLRESLLFLSWGFCIIHMIPKTWKHQKELSIITAPGALFTQGFATSGLSPEMHKSTILVPALQSQWLMMHVSMMLLSYAALICGSLLSIALLILRFQQLRQKIKFFSSSKMSYWRYWKNNSFVVFQNYYTQQFMERLDFWSCRVISFGFIFLTVGILCGSVWANEAWGSYWNWDPKETWAFITWNVYAIYLHIRTNPNWKGKNSAFVSSIGFFFVWICYFGVNLLGIGLHSYGSFVPDNIYK